MRLLSLFWLGMISAFSVSCFFIASVSAAWPIPRTDLRLELMLATGSQDSSGNNRIVTATWVAPSYQVDPTYGVPFAQFGGNGGLRVNTAWSWSSNEDFTITLWTRVKKSELPALPFTDYSDVYSAYPIFSSRWWNNLRANYLSHVFSFQDNHNTNAPKLTIRSDYKCWFGWIKYLDPYYGIYIYDTITNPFAWIDCSKLSDEKWHFISIKRTTKKVSIFIDDVEIYNWITDMVLPRNLVLWQSQLLADTGSRLYTAATNPILTNSSTPFRSSLAGFRFYSRSLNDIELDTLYNEYRYIQSELIWSENIQLSIDQYQKPYISFVINSIPLTLSTKSFAYQYSFDNINFTDLKSSSLMNISTNTGSLSYRTKIDVSNISDWRIQIYLKVKNKRTSQDIWSIIFFKSDVDYGISISEPDTSSASSKSIWATVTSWGNLFLSVTRGPICDATLIFEEYSELFFTNKSDNATRVCYKAYYPSTWKTIYKLSNPIQGINAANQLTVNYSLFADYPLWVKSNYAKPNDTTSMILDLISVNSASSIPGQPVTINWAVNGITITDINGDGLVDFLYSVNSPVRRAIIINNGNYTFKIAYKCAIDGTAPNLVYYWDCADPTR